MLIRPERCWLSRPMPPAKLPNPYAAQLDALRAELKVERNAHAESRDNLGATRLELRCAKMIITAMQQKVEKLEESCREKDGIIRQLEDLKL